MANIKIAELQSSLLEEVSVIDLDAVHGGVKSKPGIQAVGGSSGGGLGVAINNGSTLGIVNSFAIVSGQLGSADVEFGTQFQGFTSSNSLR
ncbi:hypothetical protein [Nostoc sp. 'Lobaria pulmonaria (5183) cyanobiont']|uniref:hypothetical protein n=1 Tax=Nostoc sp. 'Lobaria pulmonaria (5183) cyanobiont' TaxID=1618022 RepID=UPI000CF35ED9|nr:hypothetical protein [Nostoc sp. 'Lobaria pulmonaria (5183) cyanobiont']